MTFITICPRRIFLLLALCSIPAATVLADGPPGTNHRTEQAGAIQLGSSGGNINDISRAFCCSGTLGALVDIGGTKYVLSNNHVLARTNQATIGEDIIHPGLIDQIPACAQVVADKVADLSDFETIAFIQGQSMPANTVDAAIAEIVAGEVNTSGNILDIGAPSPTTAAPSPGLAVKKSGRTSGLTAGTIDAVGVDVVIMYQDECQKGRKRRALFTGQFTVTPGAFSTGGDSGSLIVEDCTPRPKPVGLLFAGGGSLTIANPISNVLSAFGATMVGEAGTPCSSAAASVASSAIGGFVEQVSRIKGRHRDFLFSLPEVVGHGVGLSKTQPGEVVIQLYVRQANDSVHRAVPARLEGARIEIVETGEIRALGAGEPSACEPDK